MGDENHYIKWVIDTNDLSVTLKCKVCGFQFFIARDRTWESTFAIASTIAGLHMVSDLEVIGAHELD